MLHKFLFIPVTLWLLLPPGICVCHGFGSLLPFLAAETITADTGPICEDTEHAPWCTEHKMSYLTDGGAPLGHALDAGLIVVLPILDQIVFPIHSLGIPEPTVHPADSPLYLNLCALRI